MSYLKCFFSNNIIIVLYLRASSNRRTYQSLFRTYNNHTSTFLCLIFFFTGRFIVIYYIIYISIKYRQNTRAEQLLLFPANTTHVIIFCLVDDHNDYTTIYKCTRNTYVRRYNNTRICV
jgi:hypothetical protein